MYLTYIKDTIGQNYLSVRVNKHILTDYFEQMSDILGSEYQTYRNNQIQRDGSDFHISVVSYSEIEMVISKIGVNRFNDILDSYRKKTYTPEFLGLGQVTYKTEQTFFVVVKDKILNDFRSEIGLTNKDLHITLGFKRRDIHFLPKDETTLIKNDSDFTKLFKERFYNENINWIHKLKSFDLSGEIYPIEINNKYLSIICDGYRMEIGEAGNELKVLTKYKYNKTTKPLTTVEIREFLKKT